MSEIGNPDDVLQAFLPLTMLDSPEGRREPRLEWRCVFAIQKWGMDKNLMRPKYRSLSIQTPP